MKSRHKMSLPENELIVGFVGSFDERKGINRLEEAVGRVDGVKLACAGTGDLLPSSSRCIFARQVNNEDLPWFYSAVDFFALPTLQEGCSNAIIEALGSGLPIISSDEAFNHDILDSSCSILINPLDIEEIAYAIERMKSETLRSKLAAGSLEKAKKFTLKQRAKNISNYLISC